jgi:hypothetical protein
MIPNLSFELLSRILHMLPFEDALSVYRELRMAGLQDNSLQILVWKHFYLRMGFSLEDCVHSNFLDELIYRRSLLKRIFQKNSFQLVPQFRGNNTYPIMRFVPRIDLVGSADYQRRSRPSRERESVFSFALMSSGVAPHLSVVDIDNRLRMTISRRSIDGTGSVGKVVVQQCLEDKLKCELIVHSVIQRRSMTIVVVRYTIDGQVRFDVIIHKDGLERCDQISMKQDAKFVDCFSLGNQLYICTEQYEAISIESVREPSPSSINNSFAWLDALSGHSIQAIATCSADELILISQTHNASSCLDCTVLLASRGAGIHRSSHLKTWVEEAFGECKKPILFPLLELTQTPSDSAADARLSWYTELQIDGDIAMTIRGLKNERTQESGILLAAIWDVAKWEMLAIINVPVKSHPLPKFHLNKNRLVIFGSDHIGCIVLIYQVISADNENVAKTQRQFGDGSGGLHTLNWNRVRFVSHIRHPAMSVSELENLQLACNERFIVVRTCRGNHIGNASGESDGALIVDAGPPPGFM